MAFYPGLEKYTGKWCLPRGKNVLKLRCGEPLPEEKQNSCMPHGKNVAEEGVPECFLRYKKR
jgi:hypothetical protein